MKSLNLNQMENLVAGDPCGTGEILFTMAASTLWGALFGGPAGAIAGVLRGAGTAFANCVINGEW
jgi:hypothetical protein